MTTTPKKYKQTEIGSIPDDWEVKELGELTERIIGGGTPSRSNPNFWGNEIPWVTVKDFATFNGFQTQEYITKEGLKNSASHLIPKGVIITSTRMGLGKVVIYNVDVSINQDLKAIFPKKNIDTNFFYYWFQFNAKNIEDLGSGSTVMGISLPDLKKIKVKLPTFPEQTAIANALNDADALITQLEKLIVKKRQIKQGAMQELLKPKEGWVEKKLGDLGECFIGLTYNPKNVKSTGKLVLRSSNIQGNKLTYDDNVFVDMAIPEKIRNQKGDILICVRNGSRNLIGKCAYINGRAIGETFGAFMAVFRSSYNEFIFHVFQSDIIKRQIEEHIGATINQITNKSLNSFVIPFPPKVEQTQIAQTLSDMDAEIAGLEQKLAKYRKLKAGMMQNLLTGKIRLV